MIEIGKRIKELRQDRGLTQKQLADILFVSQDTISLWELGKLLPSITNLIAICDFFKVSADDLLGRIKW